MQFRTERGQITEKNVLGECEKRRAEPRQQGAVYNVRKDLILIVFRSLNLKDRKLTQTTKYTI